MENINKRITKRERFQSLIELVELCEGREDEGFDFEGLTDFLSNEIRLLDAKKGSNSRKQTVRQTENEHFKALIAEQLTEEGMTIAVVTHEMGYARQVADRVIFMDGGRIMEQGPPSTFFTNPQNERTKAFLKQVLH